MENIGAGKICPVCQEEIREGETAMACPDCGTLHHAACWEAHHGCAAPDCPGQRGEQSEAQPQDGSPSTPGGAVCAKCGQLLEENQAFCPKCGTPRSSNGDTLCSRCGAPVTAGQAFCPKCGQKVGAAIGPQTSMQAPPRGGQKLPLIIGGVVLAVIVIVVLVKMLGPSDGSDGPRDTGPDFAALYAEYCDPTWSDLGSDGSYLYLDTNPDDEEDSGLAYPAAYSAVEEINSALGLPDSLLKAMGETTGADGRQSEDYDNVSVSWRYHPDKGLEVTYEKPTHQSATTSSAGAPG